jgi:cell division protein FtsB
MSRRAARAGAGSGPERPRRRVTWKVIPLVVIVAVVGVLVVTVFPFRSYLSQQHRTSAAEAQLISIQKQNKELAAQAARLKTPGEIERLARSTYGMVRPGETAYAILPAPAGSLRLPQLWPYAR